MEDDDESGRIAALEALALIFELGCFNSFSSEAKCSGSCLIQEGNMSTNGHSSIQEMKDNILHQVRRFSLKDEGDDEDHKKDWSKVFETKFMKRILGSGFDEHMQEHEFLHELFVIVTPEREDVTGYGCDLCELDSKDRMHKSPNSFLNKARTQLLSKRRMLLGKMRNGHYLEGDEY